MSRSLRLVMMSVLDGGDGEGMGGMVERSMERLEREERAEEERDVGDGVRLMPFMFD